MAAVDPVLAVRGLTVTFTTPRGPVTAVRGIDFDVLRGELFALVGASGAGKSQAALAVMGVLDPNGSATGSARLDGDELLDGGGALARRRGVHIALAFQDAAGALNPYLRIGVQIGEMLRRHAGLRGRAATARAAELLDEVRIPDATDALRRYPHELSGGQRQRVLLALAASARPAVLIADEPTSALDVTVQAQVLDVVDTLRRRHGMAVLLITHDLGIVAGRADRVGVMDAGALVETGTVDDVFYRPQAAATRALLDAVRG